jgi:hypothetical protein
MMTLLFPGSRKQRNLIAKLPRERAEFPFWTQQSCRRQASPSAGSFFGIEQSSIDLRTIAAVAIEQ